MSALRTEALLSLEAAIRCFAPDLDICPWPVPPTHKLMFPSLGIVPTTWTFYPDQASEHARPDPDTVVLCVGRDEVLLQLRLVHATGPQRADVEEQLLEAFRSTPLHPRELLTTVRALPRYGDVLCAWELQDETWQDEKAFDQEFWSVITVTGQVPALVTRRPAHTIRDLRLRVVRQDTTETVRVHEDGTYEILP